MKAKNSFLRKLASYLAVLVLGVVAAVVLGGCDRHHRSIQYYSARDAYVPYPARHTAVVVRQAPYGPDLRVGRGYSYNAPRGEYRGGPGRGHDGPHHRR